jgi:serine/threonine-protein phosphatase 2A regulatory subunit A
MKDSVTEVRVSLMQNIGKLAKKISEEQINKVIIPEVQKLSKDNTWRVRLATIQFIPALAASISQNSFKEHIEPLLKQWLEDSVHTIRVETIICLVKLKNTCFNLEWLERLLDSKLEEFCKHQKFSIRIHTLFTIQNVHKEVSDQYLNERLYKAFMKKLADDPVPNIKFNFSKTAQLIYKKLSNSNKMDCTSQLKKLSEDADFDVKYYSVKTLNSL